MMKFLDRRPDKPCVTADTVGSAASVPSPHDKGDFKTEETAEEEPKEREGNCSPAPCVKVEEGLSGTPTAA